MYSVYYDVRRNNRIFVPEKLTKNLDTLFLNDSAFRSRCRPSARVEVSVGVMSWTELLK